MRVVHLHGSAGESVLVITGLTRDHQGHRVVALAVSTADNPGPTAVLSQAIAGRVFANVRLAYGDLLTETRRRGNS